MVWASAFQQNDGGSFDIASIDNPITSLTAAVSLMAATSRAGNVLRGIDQTWHLALR